MLGCAVDGNAFRRRACRCRNRSLARSSAGNTATSITSRLFARSDNLVIDWKMVANRVTLQPRGSRTTSNGYPPRCTSLEREEPQQQQIGLSAPLCSTIKLRMCRPLPHEVDRLSLGLLAVCLDHRVASASVLPSRILGSKGFNGLLLREAFWLSNLPL